MTFNSAEYFLFLGIVVAIFWSVAPKLRQPLLLAASYGFYASWSWRYVPLLLLTTFVSFRLALAIPTAEARRQAWLLRVGVGGTAVLVVSFKTLEVLTGGIGIGGGLDTAGTVSASTILVPIGLSFYSFQVISYLIDVRRGTAEPCRSFVTYALFVAFFPHLLAGPIVRAPRLIPQFDNRRKRPNPVVFREGMHLLFLGLFKKVVLADVLLASVRPWLSGGVVDDPRIGTPIILLGQTTVLLGNFFDIAGYIDMARGSAKLFGVRMPQVFAQPFTRSRNWTEFWRRWQIPIMGWFRDYVYRPIRERGRHTGRSESVALLGTFLAAALWHGVSPGWICWGLVTAGILLAERRFQARRKLARPKGRRHVRSTLYLFGCLLISTPFAATPSLDLVPQFYWMMISSGLGAMDWNMLVFCAVAVAALILSDAHDRHLMDAEGFPDAVSKLRALAYGLMAVGLLVFSGPVGEQFVYFRF